jgi:hypothetical protein
MTSDHHPPRFTRQRDRLTDPDRIRLLCIGGTGQNGATLLSRMLGGLPGFVAVGELGYLWDKGLMENVACGCGIAFRDCDFWTRVGEEAFGGWDAVNPREAVRLRGAVKLRGRPQPLALPLILLPAISPAYRVDLLRYSDLMQRLYRGIASVAGDRVIVDSMKRPSHVYMMRGLPDVDLRLVHQVRDSRGVAYSNLKWVRRQGDTKGPYRVRRPPAKTGARWMWINLAFHALARLGVPTATVRYEELVRNPRPELMRIGGLAGVTLEDDDLGFIDGDEADFSVDHLVAGNRLRLQGGRVRLRTDEEWRAGLTPRQRRAVSLVTWPLLKGYGYA